MSVFYAYPGEIAAARAVGLAVTATGLVPIVMNSLIKHGHASDGDDMSIDYYFDTPCSTPDTVMSPVNKRAVNPIETPKPKRVYESPHPRDHKHTEVRRVHYTGPSYTAAWCRDFSAIQRTRVNPVTGRIIGYKGIPRKRPLSPTSKYSSFWRDQKYAKPSLHASRSPGIWDSARR